jgi:anti-sigma-K factor RskA
MDDAFMMAGEAHVLELLPAYALGALEAAEARAVAEHVAGCTLCRRELRAFQDVAAGLAFAQPEVSPPPELKARLAQRIQGLDQKRPQAAGASALRRLLPVAGIAGALLLLVLAASTFWLWQRLQSQEVLAGPRGMRAIALENTNAAPDASGFVIIGADGKNGVLVVDRLPPLDAGHEYQVWLERDGEAISGGVFPVDESGYRGMRIQAPENLLLYSTVRVTIEPAGGSPRPLGEEVLGGSLFNR